MNLCEININVVSKICTVKIEYVKKVYVKKKIFLLSKSYNVLNSIEPESFKLRTYYLSFFCGSEKFNCKTIVEKVRKALSKRIGTEVEITSIIEEMSYEKWKSE